MRKVLVVTAAVGLAVVAAAATARAAHVRLSLVGRFDQPVYLTAPPGDRRRQFVVERAGRILVIRDGRVRHTPFLDMRRDVLIRSRREDRDQRGLLSVAFAPDYATSGRFYVFYTGRDDTLHVDELHRRTAE